MSIEMVSDNPRPGSILEGRYKIQKRLGTGGMGVVYEGERLKLGRRVAIKFLHTAFVNDKKLLSRFEREARAMSKLAHPHCVSVIDFGIDKAQGAPYIVMDFVTGKTVRELMDQEPVVAARAVNIGRQMLAGLAHAHGQGITHRDIKPANIMLSEATGTGDHVRILDFGLAKLRDAVSVGDQSMASMVVGTPNYMSPEQTRGETVDARSDIYSSGVVLFELLTGKKPFVAAEAFEVLRMHRDKEAPTLKTINPNGDYSPELETAIAKALAKDPNKRFQSAVEFAAALDQVPEAGLRQRTSAESSSTRQFEYAQTIALSPKEVSSMRAAAQFTPLPHKSGSWGLKFLFVAALAGGVAGAYFLLGNTKESASLGPNAPGTASAIEPEAGSDKGSKKSPPGTTGSADKARAAGTKTSAAARPDAARSNQDDEPVGVSDDEPIPSEAAAELDDSGDGTGEDPEQEAAVDRPKTTADPTTNTSPPTKDNAGNKAVAPAAGVVKTIADAERALRQGRNLAAITGLRQMKRDAPASAYIPLLLGHAYFDEMQWTNALNSYREAFRKKPAYGRQARVVTNCIRAMGSDRTYKNARGLLWGIGRSTLPALRRAAKTHKYSIVRQRAAALAKVIAKTR